MLHIFYSIQKAVHLGKMRLTVGGLPFKKAICLFKRNCNHFSKCFQLLMCHVRCFDVFSCHVIDLVKARGRILNKEFYEVVL